MPTSDSGKAIASRNATTHGLFARDVVLPSLGEDPSGYHRLEAEWTAQLVPRNLLERHYVEKIAAASWRLRRLHRWQAQLFEDDGLTEGDRLDRLNTVQRHETALHRQIDTAVRMLSKDVPQLYTRRVRDQVLEDVWVSERACADDPDDAIAVEMETRNRLYRMRKSTEQTVNELSQSPLDTAAAPDVACPPPAAPDPVAAPASDLAAAPEEALPVAETAENCQNELAPAPTDAPAVDADLPDAPPDGEKCQNELAAILKDPRRLTDYLDPEHRHRVPACRARPVTVRRVRRG